MNNIKIIVIGLFTILSLTFVSAKEKNDWTKEKLKGKVKSYVQTSYKVKGLGKDNKLNIGDVIGEEKISFNEKGNKIKAYSSYADILIVGYEYDEKDNLIHNNTYTTLGKLIEEVTFRYDNNGNKIEMNRSKPNGIKRKCSYGYDKVGNLIQEKCYDADDMPRSKVIYKYDENNNQIEKDSYNSSGKSDIKINYYYDSEGNKIKEATTFYEKLSGNVIYQYDNKGNVIYVENTGSSGNVSRYAYKLTYDEHNNWIKKVFYSNDIPKRIIEREYTYY